MTAREFEDLLAAQRRAMVRDIPTSDATASTETPTLTRAELAEMLRDRVGLNKQESREMVGRGSESAEFG
jgi:integration host factor subunit alpha